MANLPDYRVRLSRRARRGRLRVGPLGRVEVVLPASADPAIAEELVAQRVEWIQRQRARIRRERGEDPDLNTSRPACIGLAALGEQWPIQYRSGPHVSARQADGRLKVAAPDDAGVRQALRRWLQRRARAALPDWAQQVSAETGLGFQKASVRGQKGRWGSCSRAGNLSLNRNLLLLEPATVRYLLIHELVHTEHPDHSPAFWARVAELAPDYRRLDARLTEAGARLPLWVYPDEEIPDESI
jgi:hypothetical protein